MATTIESSAPANLESSRRSLAYGLWWGAVMLFLMALWLKAKYPDMSMGIIWGVLLLAVVAMAQGIRLFLAPSLRRLAAVSFLGWGVLLLAVGTGLAFANGLPTAFAETTGFGLLALIALGTGVGLLQPPDNSGGTRLLEGLMARAKILAFLLFGMAIVLLILAIWLIFFKKAGWPGAPVSAGSLLLAFLFLGFGLWLTSFTRDNSQAAEMGAFFMILGGVTGLILSLMTLWQAWLWREEYFFGGLPTWQKEESWRIWLLGYVGLISLTLMFGSLLLGRAEVRQKPWLRRTLYGYNAGVNALIVLAILVVLNIVGHAAFPYRFEWSGTRGIYTLHEYTKNLLAGLKEPTAVYVLMPQRHPGFSDVRTLMENCQAETSLFQVRYVSPELNYDKFQNLMMRFPEIKPEARAARFMESGRGILLVYGKTPEVLEDLDPKKTDFTKIPHTFIPERKIFDSTPPNPHTKEEPKESFKGEEEVVKELKFLTDYKTKRKIYFLQGNEELDITVREAVPRRGDFWMAMARLGAGTLVERLRSDNYEVFGLNFGRKIGDRDDPSLVFPGEAGPGKKKDVPEDAWALIVASPGTPLAKETLDALDRYMQKKGRMVVLLDVISDKDGKTIKTTGMEEFLQKYGVEATTDFVLHLPSPRNPNIRVAEASSPPDSKTQLAKRFEDIEIPLETVRVVRPQPTKGPFRAEVLFQVAQDRRFPIWAENDVTALGNPLGYVRNLLAQEGVFEKKLKPEPLPVAVTVTEGEDKPRLVVLGDADFIANDLQTRSAAREYFYGILSSSLDWLGERQVLGIPAKQTNSFSFGLNVDRQRLLLVPGLLKALFILGLGIGIWVVRRR